MKALLKFLYRSYSATALVREQLLVTLLGYKSPCRHSPTCSRYTHEMIQKNGLATGVALGIRRLATCW